MRDEMRSDMTGLGFDEMGSDAARSWLHDLWGVTGEHLDVLPAGHTNSSYQLHGAHGSYIVRVSWRGKAEEQLHHEAAVIDRLRGHLDGAAVPRALATRGGLHHMPAPDGRWVQVFECIPGSAGTHALSADQRQAAMQTLARIHHELASMPAASTNPLHWLEARTGRVRQRLMPPGPALVTQPYDDVIARMGDALLSAHAWLPESSQWLHGDYHAGNLLFDGNRLSGVVDFDDTGLGSPTLEAAFAAFALSRDPRADHAFRFDHELWQQAFTTYAQARGAQDMDAYIARRDLLATLFCTDQVLIHLEAAQRGLWALGPGIGFLGCWRHLLNQCA